MKHFLLILTLLLIPFMLFASNDDLSKAKGITQDMIVQLTPSPAQEDVSRNTKIEAVFTVPLDAKHIKKHDTKLRCLSHKKKDKDKKRCKKKIKGVTNYIEAEKKVIFSPDTSLEPGLYEVEIKSLKADKAHKKTKIKEIKYRFAVVNEILQSITISPDSIEIKEGESLQLEVTGHYDTGVEKDIAAQVQWSAAESQIVTVDANASLKALEEGTTTVTAKMENIETTMTVVVYKEINGHRLPPEPDKALNDSTLLGIDTNDNGVRDDVERYIYERFGKDPEYPKTKIALAMQYAWSTQRILETPTIESKKYLDDAIDCQYYWLEKKTEGLSGLESIKYSEKHGVFNDTALKDIMMNTKERILQKFKFNTACSGHIFNGRGKDTIDRCQTNIDVLGE